MIEVRGDQEQFLGDVTQAVDENDEKLGAERVKELFDDILLGIWEDLTYLAMNRISREVKQTK